MRILLYEFVTGGGWWHLAGPPTGSLLAEGAAMVQSIAADLAEFADVLLMRDVRLSLGQPLGCELVPVECASDELAIIERHARSADWTMLIAPETSGALLQRSILVESVGGHLLSPSSACIKIAGNKQATAELLSAAGVPIPRGELLASGCGWPPGRRPFPAVIKPIDGCGSQGLQLLKNESDFSEKHFLPIQGPCRIEEFIPGLAASVSVLCGPAGNIALPACEQRLSADGRFTYLGGRLPLEPGVDARARRLALAAAGALPEPMGYIGVDLVLGNAVDGGDDRVIEINPRLTTSYVGLRALSQTNLSAAMLAVVSAHPPTLSFNDEQVEFTAAGVITTHHSLILQTRSVSDGCQRGISAP